MHKSYPIDPEPTAKEQTNNRSRLLAEITYDAATGPAVQTFEVHPERQGQLVDVVQMRVLDNWGSDEWTCVYRLRVHGKE